MFIVSSGNFLEMYDFMVFGYYATAIARTFFPSSNENASLLLSLMTFGAGFLMRPLGADLLGAYLDRHGRRAGLLLTLGLMAVGTVAIAFMPGYESLGLLAPVLVLIGATATGPLRRRRSRRRLGLLVGDRHQREEGLLRRAGSLPASKWPWSSPRWSGWWSRPYSAREDMLRWGWRIPLIIGCVLIPFIFVIRRALTETDEFIARKHRPSPREVFRSLYTNWQHRAARHDDGDDDDGVVLFHHRVYPDVRECGSRARPHEQHAGHVVCRA